MPEILLHPPIRSCHVRSSPGIMSYFPEAEQTRRRPPSISLTTAISTPGVKDSTGLESTTITWNWIWRIFSSMFEYVHPCASGGQPLCLCIVIRSHWNLKFISCVCCQNLPVSVTNIYSKANYFWLLVLLCLDLPGTCTSLTSSQSLCATCFIIAFKILFGI